MSADTLDIKGIVDEVIRRLVKLGDLPSPSAPIDRVSAPRSEPIQAGRDAADSATLVVPSRLVTLATIESQLDSLKTVVVPPDAIVTPAVKDELRRRAIQLRVASVDAPADERSSLLLLSCTESSEAEQSSATLAQSFAATIRTRSDLKQAVRSAEQWVGNADRVAILMTDRPLAAVCLANRLPTIRAAAGANVGNVDEAIETIGANLLITDPRQIRMIDWKQMVARFQRGLPRMATRLFR